MEAAESPNLVDQAFDEIAALERTGAVMPLQLKPREAFYLLRILQISTWEWPKNSRFTEPEIAYALKLGREIEGRLCKTPATREIGALGWVPVYREPAPPDDIHTPSISEPVAAKKKTKTKHSAKGK